MRYLIDTAKTYKTLFSSPKFLWSFFVGWLMLIGSLFVNFYAGLYATERASNAVTDIILSNIRVYDVDVLFVGGSIIFWIFVFLVGLYKPQRFPFVLKSIALFILIRSLFISLTHIGPFPTHVMIDPQSIINNFSFGADLFFSAHTGLPFLLALIFWDNIYLRIIFIFSALMFGTVVLLGHLHYSIDVLSAFFITYTIYHIARHFFKDDVLIFNRGAEYLLHE